MEEQSKPEQTEDVEAHHRGSAGHRPHAGLVEEPGTPDEQGGLTDDDDVEAHVRGHAGFRGHAGLADDDEPSDEHGKRGG
jgi:hypothetical protein